MGSILSHSQALVLEVWIVDGQDHRFWCTNISSSSNTVVDVAVLPLRRVNKPRKHRDAQKSYAPC